MCGGGGGGGGVRLQPGCRNDTSAQQVAIVKTGHSTNPIPANLCKPEIQ